MGTTKSSRAGRDAARHAGLSQIIVSHAFAVALSDVRAPRRGHSAAARARQVAMYLSHVVFAMTAEGVAVAFGRSLSATYHAFRRIEKLRDDPRMNRTLARLEEMVRGAAEIVR